MLLISYQNFSSVRPNAWDSTSSLEIIQEMNAFQAGDKVSETLATPQGGSDFESVRNDWMQRQGTILLNGYDKKIETALNNKLNSWVDQITSNDSEIENPSEASTEQIATGGNSVENTSGAKSSESPKLRQNIRFSRINSLKYDLGESTSMNLTADPGNTRVNLSQSLSHNAKFGVEHRTADSKTQMFLKYEW